MKNKIIFTEVLSTIFPISNSVYLIFNSVQILHRVANSVHFFCTELMKNHHRVKKLCAEFAQSWKYPNTELANCMCCCMQVGDVSSMTE